jgi:hypothetical protein
MGLRELEPEMILSALLRFGLIAVITAIAVAGLSRLFAGLQPKSADAGHGTIRPERISAVLTVVFGLALVLAGLVGVAAGGLYIPIGLIIAIPGAVIAGFMAPSLTNLHVLNWSAEGIEGPCATFGLTLGLRRTLIRWDDVRKTGKTSSGYWFIESGDHRRIYWSYLYKGYGAFVRVLAERCPSLELPADLPKQV